MSENLTRIDSHEMLKAMYNFDATLAKTLSFKEGDYFILHQSNNKQRNWWQVVNIQGQLGFVPSNYVSPIKVEPLFMIKFIEECVARMNDGTQLTPDKQELINRLNEKRHQAEISLKPYIKKQAPQPPSLPDLNPSLTNGRSHTQSEPSPIVENRPIVATPPAEPSDSFNSETVAEENHNDDNGYENLHYQEVHYGHHHLGPREPSPGGRSPQRSQSSPSMGIEDGGEGAHMAAILYGTVERVRQHTRLSHDMSRVAVTTVLECLKEVLDRGRCTPVWTLSSLAGSSGPLAVERATLRNTSDARRLRSDLSALAACAQDAQQRAWALHDDEHTIMNHLTEVVSVLTNADVRISCDVLSIDNYDYVSALVLFYQMETRWHIRQLLIQAFGVMCALDREIVRVLCSSVLARELARDMLANQSHAERLTASAKLLTAVLSMADPLPLSHFEQLDLEFVSFLLEWIESPPESDTEDHIPEQFLSTILALNLQFHDLDNNLILDALQTRLHSKVFTEKLLLLLNREDDPVRVLEHQPPAPHSVLKLSLDTFSRRSTASLFYTNDTKVLLDITVRQLADLSAGDQRRALYLQLCLGVLRHTDYGHCHRQADLLRCFTRIFCEEGEASKADQNLVRTISNEFPQYFKA